MEEPLSTQEQQLCQLLLELPNRHRCHYSEQAANELLESLFWCMAGGKAEYMELFFPTGGPTRNGTLKLREAQGAVEGAEYTEAARGRACGHIFKQGEASYACRTCSADDTCCLCSKCFDATDHTGHMVRISISPGNSGCCDCGDPEAWKKPMFCTIHSMWEGDRKGKGKEEPGIPEDLIASIRMTISRVFDYMCDVISCSPEQLRQTKTVESIEQDERMSRLSSTYAGGDKGPPDEYCVLLWNDEKHTVIDVRDQVARACSTTLANGLAKAYETDGIGRSLLMYHSSIEELIKVAEVLERIRVTVTIRSARDTYREQMVGTMIEWLRDISGCSVGQDHQILRQIVCEEMLKPWRKGSPASHANVGKDGIDDEDLIEREQRENDDFYIQQSRILLQARAAARTAALGGINVPDQDSDGEGDGEGDDDDVNMDMDDYQDDDDDDDDDVMMIDTRGAGGDITLQDWQSPDTLEEAEATAAGYPPPPPPPPALSVARQGATRDREPTPSDSEDAGPVVIIPPTYLKNVPDVPKTPGQSSKSETKTKSNPGHYWLVVPPGYVEKWDVPAAEDLFQRVRLDWMILFDLRMWKKVRNDLRSLYISTVVTIPEFKRILGLRFAGLYTTLAQLYLIGDREPDHSIINISLQMLTTPSITAEVVERGNFLTSLMAILYTFLTTRQVGHPWDVDPTAVLAFDTGSVTNRRMYHFFLDLKYLFGSPHVQERLRTEERYMMQFLDLVKLHQGICPNVRAVGEHVEYETDSWISASLVTREINRLCRQFAESFRNLKEQDFVYVSRAIRLAAKEVIINSIGAERHRFVHSEIRDETKYKIVGDYEFQGVDRRMRIVRFVVEEEPLSFHHALHYTLSWLIECGKSMSAQELKALLSFTPQELIMEPHTMGKKKMPARTSGLRNLGPEEYLLAAFDYPLRVCAWLSQMKAGMWVRNGLSLRHQAGTYRGVGQRDVAHHRDIFLLQTAFVVCDPARVLASIVDRFAMDKWTMGIYEQKSLDQDDGQHLDVIEDMIHLLIIILSDRTSLMRNDENHNPQAASMRRDLTHVLCFKPLSFSDICIKLPDKFQEQEDFHRILDEMATFKSPEGLSDIGTFELKPQYIEDVDPYIAHYNKNQREEAEMAWRKWMAKKTGKPIEEVVYEPKCRPITSGVFAGLPQLVNTGMFAQIVYYSLLYPLVFRRLTPSVPITRVESFLHVLLHLVLIAVNEDNTDEADDEAASFIKTALNKQALANFMPDKPLVKTIASLLSLLSTKEEYKACHPKVSLILRKMRQKYPKNFEAEQKRHGLLVDDVDTASPAANSAAEEERELKKQAALARQARVMQQFKQQREDFMRNQGEIDWGDMDDLEDDEDFLPAEEHRNSWKYPGGTCILCQEETDDRKLYGSFAYVTNSSILRQTDFQDPDFVREAFNTPDNLDRSAEEIRPFGVAGENRQKVEKINQHGDTFEEVRQVVGKGFPYNLSRPGPVTTSCGHIMHYSCFEAYFDATVRRHTQQIARHPPEDTNRLEFVCPLCKALGNAFLPIIWKGKEESYPGPLVASTSFTSFLETQLHSAHYTLGAARPPDQMQNEFASYTQHQMVSNLAEKSSQLLDDAWVDVGATGTPFSETFSIVSMPDASSRGATPERSSSMMRELVNVFRRLRDTFIKNGIPTVHLFEPPDAAADELFGSDVLARSVGFSISAVEIQQRGVDAEYGMTFLERIPDQVLTHLRILSETVTSFVAVGALRENGENRIDTEFRRDSERQHCQLFMAQYFDQDTEYTQCPEKTYPSLLSQDPFVFLCESVFGMAQAHNMDIAHLVRLCYLAEITKVVYHLGRNTPATLWMGNLMSGRSSPNSVPANFAAFCSAIFKMDLSVHSEGLDAIYALPGENKGFEQLGLDTLGAWYQFVRKYALTFLRKCVILLHVKFGVDFNSRVSPSPEQTELERLTEMLRVPSFDEMLTALVPEAGQQCGWPADTDRLVEGWVRHFFVNMVSGEVEEQTGLPLSALVSHPGIYELVGLPKNYDTLIEECTRRRCPTKGKDISDPLICLFCGDIFCGQAVCCAKEVKEGRHKNLKIGGAQQHMQKCQKNIGLFINIRKCCVLYLARGSGSFSHAPYIDRYGETDLGLRYGRQLFLHQKRYDSMLRNLWLGHGVPSFIARKLEADINNGGWETI
ncbi:E3 ubiquitin-protein ligase [Podospora australis]|uniref:E3 ubiquitin-protein ligase n=1 Tax=Podospora australis TaxID=1536484 RepID=A0AAN6X5X5_9PEZI|nr:E3 ubiquitin-protein ligase [Podospora australis]